MLSIKKVVLCALVLGAHFVAVASGANVDPKQDGATVGRPVIYQIFTRLYGNTITNNVPWGTVEQNGVGKFSDINEAALESIRDLGATHVWYTGVLHHAIVRDFPELGIESDDPDVVKGRAGSPYAIKDYYSVNPDLADDVTQRVVEFERLIERTHRAGLKVMIDIVPNHVARNYRSLEAPAGVEDFGSRDDVALAYHRDNSFYYVPGSVFEVPSDPSYEPLGGASHPKLDGKFDEYPAKWTGNGARAPKPDIGDWYETVKINFGVDPEGRHDFAYLPSRYATASASEIVKFWSDKPVPASWQKFLDIALFWLDKGVDGFRYDMAQMVPVEFWSYLNSHIKARYPEALLLAEIYEPHRYRDYLGRGKMDVLYSKMEIYDAIKAVMKGEAGASRIREAFDSHADIDAQMLLFLENHDEQRIASEQFMGSGRAGLPGVLASVMLGKGPVMIYFAQELGEAADVDAGFGKASRTTIFDYWGVETHQRFMNEGRFDGGASLDEERWLRAEYKAAFNLASQFPLDSWDTHFVPKLDLDSANRAVLAFERCGESGCLLFIANMSGEAAPLRLSERFESRWSQADSVLRSSWTGKGPFDLESGILSIPAYATEIRFTEAASPD